MDQCSPWSYQPLDKQLGPNCTEPPLCWWRQSTLQFPEVSSVLFLHLSHTAQEECRKCCPRNLRSSDNNYKTCFVRNSMLHFFYLLHHIQFWAFCILLSPSAEFLKLQHQLLPSTQQLLLTFLPGFFQHLYQRSKTTIGGIQLYSLQCLHLSYIKSRYQWPNLNHHWRANITSALSSKIGLIFCGHSSTVEWSSKSSASNMCTSSR